MRFFRDRIVQVCLAVVALGLLIAVVWSARTPDGPLDDDDNVADPPETVQVEDTGGTLLLDDVDDLDDAVGQRVVAEDAEVESVPADEGFWVDTGSQRAWVQLDTAGESPFVVEAGQRVSFTGEVVAHGADFAERPEFSEVDANELVDAGAHIEVRVRDVEIVGSS